MDGVQFVQLCSAFSAFSHNIWVGSNNCNYDTFYVPLNSIGVIKVATCCSRNVLYKTKINRICDEGKPKCNFKWFIVYIKNEDNVNGPYFVHPESFHIIEQAIDPNGQSVLKFLRDIFEYHPVFGSLVAETKKTTQIGKEK